MEKSNFVDQIKIFCRSGHGGAGSKHFMRNKLTAMGGPDGGDGGRGAHIILKGNTQLWTLLHLRYYKNVLAEDGENGSKNNSSGKTGKPDAILISNVVAPVFQAPVSEGRCACSTSKSTSRPAMSCRPY